MAAIADGSGIAVTVFTESAFAADAPFTADTDAPKKLAAMTAIIVTTVIKTLLRPSFIPI